MTINSNQIQSIVDKVMDKLASEGEVTQDSKEKWKDSPSTSTYSAARTGNKGVYNSVTDAVESAKIAYNRLNELPLSLRAKIIESIRQTSRKHCKDFARMAH